MVGMWTKTSQRFAESLVYLHLHSGTLPTLGAQGSILIASCAVKTPMASEGLPGTRRIRPMVPARILGIMNWHSPKT